MPKFTLGHHRAAKLSPSQVLELRTLYAEQGWSQGRLARHFGLSVGQVGRIVRGESWQSYTRIPTDEEIEDRAFHNPVKPDIPKFEETLERYGITPEKPDEDNT